MNEYKPWYRGNDPQKWREDLGAYKRPFKERYERPPEYTPPVKEYQHYPSRLDLGAEQEKKQQEYADKNSNSQASDTKQTRSGRRSMNARTGQTAVKSVVQSVVGNTVALVMGATILVAGYQAMESASKLMENWTWAEDNQTVVFALSHADGDLVAELPALIDVDTVVEATCTTEGLANYTAVVEYDGKEYKTTKSESLPALGHSLTNGKMIELEDGKTAMEFECEQCHKKFVVENSVVEED